MRSYIIFNNHKYKKNAYCYVGQCSKNNITQFSSLSDVACLEVFTTLTLNKRIKVAPEIVPTTEPNPTHEGASSTARNQRAKVSTLKPFIQNP